MNYRYAAGLLASVVFASAAACESDDAEPRDGGAGEGGSSVSGGAGGQADAGEAGDSPAQAGAMGGAAGEGGAVGASPGDAGAASGGEAITAGAGGSGGTPAGSAGEGGASYAGRGSEGGASYAGQGGEGGAGGASSECPTGDETAEPKTCSDTFTITTTCLSGPCAQQSYAHTYDVTWTGLAFSGTGTSTEGSTTYTETICGAVSGDELTFHTVYTSVVPGYTIDGTATLASDKTATGSADGYDPRGATQQLDVEVSTLNVGCE